MLPKNDKYKELEWQESRQSPHKVQFQPAFPDFMSVTDKASYLQSVEQTLQSVHVDFAIFILAGYNLLTRATMPPTGQYVVQ